MKVVVNDSKPLSFQDGDGGIVPCVVAHCDGTAGLDQPHMGAPQFVKMLGMFSGSVQKSMFRKIAADVFDSIDGCMFMGHPLELSEYTWFMREKDTLLSWSVCTLDVSHLPRLASSCVTIPVEAETLVVSSVPLTASMRISPPGVSDCVLLGFFMGMVHSAGYIAWTFDSTDPEQDEVTYIFQPIPDHYDGYTFALVGANTSCGVKKQAMPLNHSISLDKAISMFMENISAFTDSQMRGQKIHFVVEHKDAPGDGRVSKQAEGGVFGAIAQAAQAAKERFGV